MAKRESKNNKNLSKVIDVEKNYNFLPYSYTPYGVSPLQFFKEDSKEVKLIPREVMSPKASILLVVLVPALISSKSESKQSVVSYNPK